MTNADSLGGQITIGDITVPRMGYGAMQLTGPGVWGDPDDRQKAMSVLSRVRELGIGIIDTANAYGPDTNETLIADALHPYGSVHIATKGGLTRSGPGQWDPDGRPGELKAACEASLKRLSLETIDIYQLHRPDPKVPLEESVGALAEMQREGKIRHIGVSNVSVAELRTAQSIAPIVSVQNRYNLADRASEDVLQVCEAERIAFFPWFPVASGELARPGGGLDDVARKANASIAQASLAWLLQHSPVIVPIPGTSSIAHLEENTASASIQLTPEMVSELESAAG